MTEYKIAVNLPNTAKGQVVSIPGIGEVKNGSSKVLTEEQVSVFRGAFAVQEVGEDDVTYFEPGPTPLQANWPEGITVETYTKETAEEKAAREKSEAEAKKKAEAEAKKNEGGSN